MTKPDLRKERGLRTRGAILSAAYKLLTEEGFYGFTAGKLAARAKVSKAILFHYFENIEEVPVQLLESFIAQLEGYVAAKKHESIRDFVFHLGKAVIEASDTELRASSVFFQFYQMGMTDEKYRIRLEAAIRSVTWNFQAELERIRGRALSPSQRESLPSLIALALDGVGLHRRILRDKPALLRS